MRALILFIIPLWAYAQEYPRKEIEVSQVAEELYGLPDMDLNYEELYENLVQLITHPLNLNKATAEDFRFLKMLSELQIKSLIKYRTENGEFISVYELQAVPEFDLETIYALIPFVTVNNRLNAINAKLLHRIKKESDTYVLTRYERTLETKKGFDSTLEESGRFKGSPDKLFMRFRSSRPGDFSFGFTAENDPGEQIRWSPSSEYYGLDYFSYHVQLQNKGRLKNVIFGDYQSQFGQGLMLGGILGTGKGSETITSVRRSNIGLLPYTSAYESGAMRGLAFTVQASKRFSFTGFFSNAKRDATIGSTSEHDIISAFQTDGLHRNENELQTRKIISEKNLGGVIHYENNAFSAGVMFNKIQFNVPIQRTRSAYNQFAFNGKANNNIGIYLNYTIQNLVLFSEVAHSWKGGFAGSIGMLTSLSRKLDLSMLYRTYDRNFYAFYSNGFAESSNTQNERGIYWGWKYAFSRRYSVSGYVDIFKFPWLRFRNYAPAAGYEWLLRFNYDPSRKVKIFIQARQELKTRNLQTDTIHQYHVGGGKKNNYWINVDYAPHPMLRLKSRVQLSSYSVEQRTTNGFALMQDFIVDLGKLKLTWRYAVFDTEDYDNRQYAYENDVWLAYSLPAYYGSGVRKMAIIEFKINKRISLWLRYAHVRYRTLEAIGSGVDLIEGNTKNDLKGQLVFRI
jgi:hypothetical protein